MRAASGRTNGGLAGKAEDVLKVCGCVRGILEGEAERESEQPRPEVQHVQRPQGRDQLHTEGELGGHGDWIEWGKEKGGEAFQWYLSQSQWGPR